jgi:ferredoxin
MKTYRVELINRSNFVVEVAEDEYILEAVILIY